MNRTNTFKVILGGAILSAFLFTNPAEAHRVHVYRSPVVVHKGHVHTTRCGHYFYRNNWYFVKGHIHGRRCGHVLVGGVWVIR